MRLRTPALLGLGLLTLLLASCGSDEAKAASKVTATPTKAASTATAPAMTPATPVGANAPGIPPLTGEVTRAANGLGYVDEVVGTGATATAGQTVQVHYTGWLTNGQKFDSSRDRNQPFAFALGAGQVITGWDQGVAGMKVGGKRRLIIPAALGYGSRGAAPVIPPNATLIFDVELLATR